MKKKRVIAALLSFWVLTGCAAKADQPAIPKNREATYPQMSSGLSVTGCSNLLQEIWNGYTDAERFAVFGGNPQSPVTGEPGDLEIADEPMLQKRFFLTRELAEKITEGAALEHLLNPSVFCAGVFQLVEGADMIQFVGQLHNNLEEAPWLAGRPQRYLIAQPETGFLLLAYGQTAVLETFLIRMNQAYPNGQILMYQELPQKISPQGLLSANLEVVSFSGSKDLGSNCRF